MILHSFKFDPDAIPDERKMIRMTPAIRSLIHTINLIPNATILEVGISRGHSTATILQSSPDLKEYWGIDAYQPGKDFLDTPTREYTINEVNKIKKRAFSNIRAQSNCSIFKMYEDWTWNVVNEFEDQYFDFIFLDSYLNEKDVEHELKRWYPKLKVGGYYSGHDYAYAQVKRPVNKFIKDNNVKTYSIFDSVWVWKKV